MVTLHIPGRGLLSMVKVDAYPKSRQSQASSAGGRAGSSIPQVCATSTESLSASRLETWNQGLTQASDPLPAKTCSLSLRRGSTEWPRCGLGADSSISYHICELSNRSAVQGIHLSFIVKTCRSLSDVSLTSSRVL